MNLVKLLVVAVAAMLLGACGTDSGEEAEPACTEGAIELCMQEGEIEGQKKCVDGEFTLCGPGFCEDGAESDCTTTCETSGLQICQADGSWGECVAVEVCDNVDNNCDDVVDEGLVQECFCGTVPGEQTCVAGEFGACSAGEPGSAEICDGLDNDCDSLVDEECDKDHDGFCDEGIEFSGNPDVCPKGAGDCNDNEKNINPDVAEKCNSKDDNCDGNIDEDLGTLTCGGIGECEQVEIVACQGGEEVDECSEADKKKGASDEKCDGLDNDCDGEADEDLDGCCEEGVVSVCGTNDGECQKGAKECDSNKSWGECGGTDYVGPSEEKCNNKDDDCDGQVDEENPEGGGSCGTDDGECVAGNLSCVNGSVVCKDEVPSSGEVCDLKDNDCNGEVDNGLPADQYEENDTCDMARDLGEIKQAAEPVTMTINGSLYKDGATDTDWYKILAKEQSSWLPCNWGFNDGCYQLTVSLLSPEATNLELCISGQDCEGGDFAECADDLGAGKEEGVDRQWKGVWGFNDNQIVYAKVKGVNGAWSCAPYTLAFELYAECPVDGKCWFETE